MSKNQAILVQKPGEATIVEASIPKLRDDYIIVKVKAVSLNPTVSKISELPNFPFSSVYHELWDIFVLPRHVSRLMNQF